MHPDEQTILKNWYNSLTNHGSLNWDVGYNLCVQTGVTCDNSSPYKRVIKMYSLFVFLLFLKTLKDLILNREISWLGVEGTISTEFGSLINLQQL